LSSFHFLNLTYFWLFINFKYYTILFPWYFITFIVYYKKYAKAVEIKNLIKDYESFRVLKGFSFEIFQGEIFGLIGPNAAGKTTTLRIISTLIQATSGEAKYLVMMYQRRK